MSTDAKHTKETMEHQAADVVEALRQWTSDLLERQQWCVDDLDRAVEERNQLRARIDQALGVIAEDGGTDGGHHKQWVLDQVLRALLGDEYDAWIAEYNKPGYIPWDTGIAP